MADRMYPIKESELEELQIKARWFDYLASRLDNAQLKLSFGGQHNIYLYESERNPESLIEELKKAISFEEYKEDDE